MIKYKVFNQGDVNQVKDLCNDLMKYQAERAYILPEVMASMNFENRLLPEFKQNTEKFMVIAYDQDKAIAFGFANVHRVEKDEKKPSWAGTLKGQGFYPPAYKAERIGTFKLLYVKPKYRGLSIGLEISQRIMNWLSSRDIEDIWVYVANGNEIVGDFYEKLGFTLSHDVYEGFIKAYKYNLLNN